MKLYINLLILLLLKCFDELSAFNIETASITRRGFTLNNDDHSNDYKGRKFFGYSFRGNIIKREGKDVLSVMVGAPLEHVVEYTSTSPPSEGGEAVPLALQSSGALRPTESTGSLYDCDMVIDSFALDNNVTQGVIYNCTNKEPLKRGLTGSDLANNDTLGISLAADRRGNAPVTAHLPKDRMLACAHLRAHNCATNYKAEGICYLSKIVSGRGDGRYSVSWDKKSPCKEECTKSKIDLMFLVDGSESITPVRFRTVQRWIINVAAGFDLSGPVQVGVVQYSHYYRSRGPEQQRWLKTEIPLGKYNDQAAFAKAVNNISYHGYTTYTAHAIEKTVRDDFNGKTSRYPKARRVMILLTDGNSTDKEKLPDAVHYAERQGVTSFAVGVKGYVLGELLLIAGSKDRVITVENFDELQGIVSKIQFGIQVLEGSSNTNSTNGLMQCQAGISSEMSTVSIRRWCECGCCLDCCNRFREKVVESVGRFTFNPASFVSSLESSHISLNFVVSHNGIQTIHRTLN